MPLSNHEGGLLVQMNESEFMLEIIRRAQESHEMLLSKTKELIAARSASDALKAEIFHLERMLVLEQEAERIRGKNALEENEEQES